jgi:UDP-N-acetylmuramyl tripeptide synthase
MILFYVALFVAKCLNTGIRILNLGSGSTWPGEIALMIDPAFVRHSIEKNTLKPILIAGTNGKTTTARLIVHGLQKKGKRVVANPEGANLLNGIASVLVKHSSVTGHMSEDYAVFECDENAVVPILSHIKNPYTIAFLNLFRDQLDRYGEVHVIAKKWKEVLQNLSHETQLIINGDDPLLAHIGSTHGDRVLFYGATDAEKKEKTVPHDVDSVHCPQCGNPLVFAGISYSHMGNYSCSSCGYKNPLQVSNPLVDLPHFKGLYNRYNVRAALAVLCHTLGTTNQETYDLLVDCRPAFGRQEEIDYKGKKWIIILSKNPAGFNQSIAAVGDLLGGSKSSILLILNDRIPDGTDVSWIWDVEFDRLSAHSTALYISGDRTYDMAIRMETAGLALTAEENLETIVHTISAAHHTDTPIIVLATYTGMLEVRKILKGRSLL